MPQIKAHDEIVINATVQGVWKVLIDIPHYENWWPRTVNLRVLKFKDEIIGTEFKANPLGGKSFACRVISMIPNKKIKVEYFEGIYRGYGFWNIEANNEFVTVSYSVDLEIVDSSIALLSRIIPIPKLHSMIFKKILSGIERQIKPSK